MTLDRISAFRQERAELLSFCRDLDDAEWQTPSAADGWRVQDVVAHIGSACHAVFAPASMWILLGSKDIERTNDYFVDQRSGWAPAQTLAEYECWSRWFLTTAAIVSRSPLRGVRMPVAGLGRFPVAVALGGALVFDHHTHLRHDIAPALGRPVPGTDANRMAVVLEWMMAVLSNQQRAAKPTWLGRPLSISLTGPGGGCWVVGPGGSVAPGEASAGAAQIAGTTMEFPEWGSKRVDWRDRDVTLSGDTEYGAVFLDALNVV
jgi:uncharacterized protein (TIGR03083 family)